MLKRHCGYPDIIRRYRRAGLSERVQNFGVKTGGIHINPANGHSRSIEKSRQFLTILKSRLPLLNPAKSSPMLIELTLISSIRCKA